MMSRDRKIRPAMTNGWLADDIASNLRNNAGLSSSEAAPQAPPSFFPLGSAGVPPAGGRNAASRRDVGTPEIANQPGALTARFQLARRFRPCLDLPEGKVKPIIGGTSGKS
jgi:hypothetical protein